MPERSIAFDNAADYYDNTRGYPPGEDQKIGAFIAQAAGLTHTHRVLEIGVGTGRIALPLAPHTGRYVGVDLAMSMMERLRVKQTASAQKPVDLLQGDVLRLPFADNTFNAAVIVHVLHLVSDADQTVRELARVLHPEGVAIHCRDERDEAAFTPITEAWQSALDQHQPRTKWKRAKTIFRESGWQELGEQVYEFSMEQTPSEIADGYHKRRWSSLWSMPDDLWTQGVAAAEDALREHYPDPHQPMKMPIKFHVQLYTPPK